MSKVNAAMMLSAEAIANESNLRWTEYASQTTLLRSTMPYVSPETPSKFDVTTA